MLPGNHPFFVPAGEGERTGMVRVLLRLVCGPAAWLDLRGLTYLQLPVPDQI